MGRVHSPIFVQLLQVKGRTVDPVEFMQNYLRLISTFSPGFMISTTKLLFGGGFLL